MKLEHLGRYLWAKKICGELDVARVADIACATGYGCSILAQEAEQVVGIDRSYQYLEKAPKIENVTYVCKNLDTMEADIYESFFDMIVCFETIEHVKYPERLIQSFSKMLNKNGTLLLSFPNSCYEKVDENGENADIYHLHVFQKEEVEKWLKMNGFEILNCLGQSYCNLRCQAEYDALKAGRIATEELEKEHECTLSNCSGRQMRVLFQRLMM